MALQVNFNHQPVCPTVPFLYQQRENFENDYGFRGWLTRPSTVLKDENHQKINEVIRRTRGWFEFTITEDLFDSNGKLLITARTDFTRDWAAYVCINTDFIDPQRTKLRSVQYSERSSSYEIKDGENKPVAGITTLPFWARKSFWNSEYILHAPMNPELVYATITSDFFGRSWEFAIERSEKLEPVDIHIVKMWQTVLNHQREIANWVDTD